MWIRCPAVENLTTPRTPSSTLENQGRSLTSLPSHHLCQEDTMIRIFQIRSEVGEGLNNPGLERKSFDFWLWCCHFTSKLFNDSESMKGGLRIINETTHLKAWCLAHRRCEFSLKRMVKSRDLWLEYSMATLTKNYTMRLILFVFGIVYSLEFIPVK